MTAWLQQKTFKNLILIVLILLAIYIAYSILPLLGTIIGFLLKILYPFFLSILFFYFLRPITHRMERWMPRWAAIAILYLLTAVVLTLVVLYVYPLIVEQVSNLRSIKVENIVKTDAMRPDVIKVLGYEFRFPAQIRTIIGNILNEINYFIIDNLSNFVAAITQFFMFLTLVPFIVFFLLKDSRKIYERVCDSCPQRYIEPLKNLLLDIDITLSYFISGRVIIAFVTGIILFIGLLLIGLDYAFLLSAISMIFYTIPTLGAFIAMVPPTLVGFSMSMMMGIETLLVCAFASTLEGFVISPPIIEKQLFVHPLTIIFILLVGGELFGISGLLFGVPAYLLAKIILRHAPLFLESEKTLSDEQK